MIVEEILKNGQKEEGCKKKKKNQNFVNKIIKMEKIRTIMIFQEVL